MNAHPSLFDAPPVGGRVRVTDPVTSVAAARAQWGGVPALVLDVLRAHGEFGATTGEIQAALSTEHGPTVASAVARLHGAGMLESRNDWTRPTGRNGRDQLVWWLP